MARGGYRPGAGRKPNPYPKPKLPAVPKSFMDGNLEQIRGIIEATRARGQAKRTADMNPFRVALHPDAAMPPADSKLRMAMDSSLTWAAGQWNQGYGLGMFGAEGLIFLGYPYLAELAQRPEYRTFSETIATEMTRKWIKFTSTGESKAKKRDSDEGKEAQDRAEFAAREGNAPKPEEVKDPTDKDQNEKTEKIKELVDFQDHLKVRDRFSDSALNDGFFGRSHLFLDDGKDNPDELKTSIGNGRDAFTKGKLRKGFLKRIQVVEPVWTYPTTYNALNPLSNDWYNPQVWYVMSREIHRSRLLTFIGRPVPDMLKPAYSFGGLSLTQLAKPYVDIWLTTRDSVGELIHSFSVMVLMTDLTTILQPGNAGGLLARVAMFNEMRDNMGTFVVNKNSEDFKNVSVPISGLSDLQAQSQEHMMSVARIPAVKFTGIEPKGLNSTSEGTMRAFNDSINAYQNKLFKPNLDTVTDMSMISLWGKRDKEIVYDFESLVELTDKEKGELKKAKAEVGQIHIDSGVIAPEEERERIITDPESDYQGLDPDDVPDLKEEEEGGLMPGGKKPGEGGEGGGDDEGRPGAEDANVLPFGDQASDAGWSEGDHPRGQPGNAGQFGSGGGGGGKKQVAHAPQYGLQHGTFTASHGSSSFKPTAKRTNIGSEIDTSALKKVGGQMGSNPGGVYEGEGGKKFYVKQGKTKDHVRNEMTAAALYDLAGTPTLDYRPVKGGGHIATEMAKLDKDNAAKLSPQERQEAARDFAVHAWLGNWDAVGTGGDNLGTVKGVPTPLDLGGALEYRAQGAPKGKAFGESVGELDTMRDKSMSPDAAGVFGGMTPGEMRESARFVTGIPDSAIKATVAKMGGDPALAAKLIARKNDIAAKAKMFGAEGNPSKPDGTMVVPAGTKTPLATLNGVAFKPWNPPDDWAAVDGQNPDIDEPEFDPKHKMPSSGVLIREKDGRVWMVQPKNGYGGYEATFPKGGMEKGLSLQANAIKEAYEESGLQVRIVGFAGDHAGDTSMTRYYHAERVGGDPSAHDGKETEGVVLAPSEKAAGFLNRKRDRAVLAGDEKNFEEGKHKRDADGKFSSTGGGGEGAGGEVEEPEPEPEQEEGEHYPGFNPPPDATGKFKNKKEHAAHLLTEGVTTKQMLAALGWPSISMPAMAKSLGMKLEKIKQGGETKYKGTPMTQAELAAAKAEAQEKKNAGKAAPAPEPAKTAPAASAGPPKTYGEFVHQIEDPNTDPQDVANLKKYNTAWAAAYADLKNLPPAPKPTPPTQAELEKAKKNVKLQLQYVPGAPAAGTKAGQQAQKLVDSFNATYEGKVITVPAVLAQKVQDFKTLTAAMVPLQSAEQQQAAKSAAEQAEKQANANAAAAAKVAEAKKAAAAKNKEYMAALGISETEATGFHALVEMMGGNASDVIEKFKGYEKQAQGHGYPVTGFQYALIRNYIDGGYIAINKALRSNQLTPAQHVYAKMVNNALDKFPKYSGTVERGTSLEPSQIANYKPGYVVMERSFTSTGINYNFGGNVRYKIKANGMRGADFSKGANQSEKEVLFKANTAFLVHKVETKGGTTYIEMEEVDHHG